jgi:hypothetical protein
MKSHYENYNYDNITITIRNLTIHKLSNIRVYSIKVLCSQFMHGILQALTTLTFRRGYFEAFGALSWKDIGWSCLCIFQ